MLRSKFISRVLAPSFILTWTAALAYSAVFSDTGYGELHNLEADVALLTEEVTLLRERREVLQKRASLLSSKSLDPDLIDERIRTILGYSRQGDISISRQELDRAIKNRMSSNP